MISPILNTPRLHLRLFTLADAPLVQTYCGDRAVAATTATIPHPYEDGMAEHWITTHLQLTAEGKVLNFAVTLRSDRSLIGCVGLVIDRGSANAELGYWIGRPFWSQGYATEAAAAAVHHGFTALGLVRVFARCFGGNTASSRVLEKIGMTREGCLRRHFNKWGELKDIELYGVLSEEWPGL